MTPNELMHLAANKFKVLSESGKWNAPSKEEEKTISLEARISKYIKGKDKSKAPPSEKGKGREQGTKKKPYVIKERPKWMTDKPEDISTPKTENGKEYWWCERHNVWALHKPDQCYECASS